VAVPSIEQPTIRRAARAEGSVQLSQVGSLYRSEVPMSRPVIIVNSGQLPWVVDQAEQAILRDYESWGLYQHSGSLVRVASAEADKDKKIHRPDDAIVLRHATVPMLQDDFGRAIAWQNSKHNDIDCPAKVAAIYLSRAGLWKLPTLVGVVNAPIVRPDGSVLVKPGFDEATGLLLHSDIAWKPPADLSKAAVDVAVETLRAPFCEFPVAPEGLSVVISAILTSLQRRLLFSAPAHAIDAPAQGSGKSLITDSVSIVATGHETVSTSVNVDPDELRKKLVSVLLAGDLICDLDNIVRPLASEALATILTKPFYQDRILGLSRMTEQLPTNVLFLLTGNNLEFSGDMPSRVIIARIEPDCEKPEQRTFNIPDLRAHIREHRVELVQAALTILQAYQKQGRPDQSLKPFGRFEQWSREIRAALVWAGLPDPCATRDSIDNADPERDATLAIFGEWFKTAAATAITLTELIHRAAANPDFHAALLSVAADKDRPEQVSARRLGVWCRNRKGRVYGDFKLKEIGHAHGGLKTYAVLRIESVTTIKGDMGNAD
jgi:putative DNA primase/helicase